MAFNDDFNRAGPGLGPDYDNVSGLSITGNALQANAGSTGEADLLRVFRAPTVIQYDIWIPNVPSNGYHGYQIEGSEGDNQYGWIDNSSSSPSTLWSFYPPGNSTSSYEFPVTGDTWITVKMVIPTNEGQMVQFKYWDQGDPEPSSWAWEEVRLGTDTTSKDYFYIYLDAFPGSYPSKIDNLILDYPTSFIANAILSPAGTSFSDFSSDFGDWTPASGDTQVDIDGGALVAPPSYWRFFSYTGDDTPRTGYARMDFYVPPDPADGYHGYTLDVFGVFMYFDNWMFTDYAGPSTTWGIVFPGSIPNHYFEPDGDTWYTIFAYVNNVDGGSLRVVIWPRDEPIPDSWDFQATFPADFPYDWQIYLDVDNNDTPQSSYESRLDNVLVYESSELPYEPEGAYSFTADAYLKETHYSAGTVATGFTGTANTVFSNTITITAKSTTSTGNGFTNQLGFISLSIDSGGTDLEIDAPFGWEEVARTELSDLNHVLVTYMHRWRNSEPNGVTFTWDGVRHAVGGAWTVAISPTNTSDHHLHIRTIQEISDPTPTTAPRGFTGLTAKGNWAAYTIFAGASSGTWGGVTGSSQFVDSSNAGASLAINRDDFNSWLVPVPNYSISPSNAQPVLGQVIIVETDGTLFTADAILDNYTFTADAVLQDDTIRQFTADARLTLQTAATFTADAFILPETTFTADAVIVHPRPVLGIFTGERLKRQVTMQVLNRLDRAKDTYVPPRVPDQKNEDPIPEPLPRCLPACAGSGAGGSMNGWGSFKKSFTYCSHCDVYFRTDSEILGNGSGAIDGNYHCGCSSAHQRDSHVTRLFVEYPEIPDGDFRLRAKLSWDINGPEAMIVVARSIPSMPSGELEDCVDLSGIWDNGTIIGNFTFRNDAPSYGAVILGNDQVKYQDDPAQMIVTKSNIQSSVMMFNLGIEDELMNARFRASNLAWR